MPYPTYEVRVDWDDDGLTAGAQDNITADVLKLRITEGIDTFGSNGEEQSLSITVDNNEGKYHDLNSSSPLFGKLKPLRRVHVNATWSGVTVGLFDGYLDAIAPEGLQSDRTAVLSCSGILPRAAHLWAPYLEQRDVTGEDYAPRDVRTAAMGLAPVSLAEMSTDYAELAPISGAGFTDDSLTTLRRLNEATLTRHYIRPGNVFVGNTAYYRTVGRNDGISTAAVDSWAKGVDFDRVAEWSGPAGALVNLQRVYGESHHTGTGIVEVWRWPGGPITLAPDAFFTEELRLGFTIRDASVKWVVSQGGLTPSTVLLADKGPVNIAVQAMSGALDTIITALWLEARPDIVTDITAESEDAASQVTYGTVIGQYVSSDLIRSSATAKGIADHIVWRNAEPRRRVRLLHENRFDAVVSQRRWPGETISITDAEFGLSSFRAQIIRRETDIDVAGESWIEYTTLEEMPPAVTPFVVGSSAIGGAHTLAR